MKYLHILDTDFEDYMIIYACQEYAEFFKDGEKMTDEQAWGKRKNTKRN